MTNYELWQLERYGNIVGNTGTKNDRKLTTAEKVTQLLLNVRENNNRLLTMIGEMPDDAFKVNCYENLIHINKKVLETIATITNQKLSS